MASTPELPLAEDRQTARKQSPLTPPAAVVASSAMLFWGTGLRPMWWLVWFAPVPMLVISSSLTRRRAFALAALSWFLGSLNLWRYLLSAIGVPVPLVLLLSVGPACLFGLAVLLFRTFVLRGSLWRATLVFPTFWVSCEYLNNLVSPHGTFGNLGYTQMDFLPVLQLTSLVGIWGISFCLFLWSATIAAALRKQAGATERVRLAIAVGLFLVMAFGYGSWRLARTPRSEHSLKVGLMATGTGTTFPHDDAAAMRLFRDYSDKAIRLAAQGAELVVLPEKIALVSDQAAGQLDTLYATASAQARATLVVGLDRGTLTKRLNEARMYSTEARLAAIYDKHHLVPGFEDVDEPGTTITVVEQPSGRWGIQICKDMDFPRMSREYGTKGVGLLLVPAWDFTLDAWLHDRMAVMRGVESGFTIVRAAKQGLLTVSDDRGRILAQQDAATVAFASLVANVPVYHDDTIYARWGDWFAWLNVAGLVVLVWRARGRRRERPLSAPLQGV